MADDDEYDEYKLLLERALKADGRVGYKVEFGPSGWIASMPTTTEAGSQYNRVWAPLQINAEAFCLAVQLRMQVFYSDNLPPEKGLPRAGAVAVIGDQFFYESVDPRWSRGIKSGEMDAMRRAIIRAAASTIKD